MTTRSIAVLLASTIALSACGDSGSSGLNPFGWFGGGGRKAGPATLEPKDRVVVTDMRQPFPRITGARWATVPEGQMLIVTALAPTKGWWDVAIVTEEAMPKGRIRPDTDGVLRLRLVGAPPAPDQAEARIAADPRVDTITTAMTIPTSQLARIGGVVISSASNSVTLGR